MIFRRGFILFHHLAILRQVGFWTHIYRVLKNRMARRWLNDHAEI